MTWLCMKDLWASNGARCIQRRLLKRSDANAELGSSEPSLEVTKYRSQDYALSCIIPAHVSAIMRQKNFLSNIET